MTVTRYADVPANASETRYGYWLKDVADILAYARRLRGDLRDPFEGPHGLPTPGRVLAYTAPNRRQDLLLAACLIQLPRRIPAAQVWSTDPDRGIYTDDWQEGEDLLERTGKV